MGKDLDCLKLFDCFSWLIRTKTTDRISSLSNEVRARILSFLPREETIRTTILSRQWREVGRCNFDFSVYDALTCQCYDEKKDDRLSYLPCDIRSYILSFLPLEETVRTTILSRHWRKVSISNFDFSELQKKYYDYRYKTPYNQPFLQIVTKSLNRYCNLDLEKLEIDVIYDDKELVSRISQWIAFSLTHNVSQLKLFLYAQTLVLPPSSFFGCKTLTKLSLRNMKLVSPTTVYFPNLQHLTLAWVEILQESEPMRFFSSFPTLEYLKLVHCYVGVKNNILTISTPKLKFFHLENCRIDGEIVISSTTLKQIKYKDDPIRYDSRYFRSISPLSSLSHATFNFSHFPLPLESKAFTQTKSSAIIETMVSGTLKILESLSNLVKLELKGYFFQFLTKEPDLFNRIPLPSDSVKHLELEMCATYNHYQIVTSLLTIYPNLHTLRILIMWYYDPYMLNNDEELYTRPENLSEDGILRKLKTVEVEGFKGGDAEIDLVRFLLENARNMEKMDMSLEKCRISDETMRARYYIETEKKFRNLVKLSPNVSISMR